MGHAVELFVIAAKGEIALKEELLARLAPLVEAGIVRGSSADPAGARVETADVIVALASPEALAEGTETRAELEKALAMERACHGVVILLRARKMKPLPGFEDRALLPRDGAPLDTEEDAATAWQGALAGVLEGVALCHVTVGDLLLKQEREAAAAAAFRRALAIAETLAGEEIVGEPELELLALVRDRLGDALLAAGDGPGAFAAYESARVVHERLVRLAPGDHKKLGALGRCFESVGEVLHAMGARPEALRAYQACLALRERLAAETGAAAARRELCLTHSRIGHVFRAMGEAEAALEAFRTGLTLAEALAGDHAADASFRADLALFCFRAATVLVEGSPAQREEARALLGRARGIYRDLEERGLLAEAQAIWPPAVEALLDSLDA